jgi:hypothetical protein
MLLNKPSIHALRRFYRLSESRQYAAFSFLCHVERSRVTTGRLASLRYSPPNGVETSFQGKRCFDSVSCDDTTLLVNSEGSDWVAQHDIAGQKCG